VQDNMNEELDLLVYWDIVRRWLWLIALAALLAGAAAFGISRWALQPTYQATARLIIEPGNALSSANYSDILAGQRAAATYAEMLKSESIQEAALEALGTTEAEAPACEVTVQPVRDTAMIDVTIECTDAEFAAVLANTLAQTFIEANEARQSERYQSTLTQLQTQIAEVEQEIANLRTRLAEVEDSAERATLETRLTQLQDALARLTTTYQNAQIARVQSVDLINVVEPARAPDSPVKPRVMVNTALAAVVGAMVAVGAVFLIEYLDTSIKTSDEAERLTALPVLGQIWQEETLSEDGKEPPQRNIVVTNPLSPVAEAFRLLRANLAFAAVDAPLNVVLVTSPGPTEGKSITALNLGAAFAAAGRQVILIDADFRRPRLYAYVGVPRSPGLSDALVDSEDGVTHYLHPIPDVDGTSILPPGRMPPNPAELLGSQRMQALLEHLRGSEDTMVIIDAPPILAAADAVVLSTQADGTLLVVEAGATPRQAVIQAIEQLRLAQGRLLGLVLNKVPTRRAGGDYYYYYYYGAPGSDGSRRAWPWQRRQKHRRKNPAITESRSCGD